MMNPVEPGVERPITIFSPSESHSTATSIVDPHSTSSLPFGVSPHDRAHSQALLTSQAGDAPRCFRTRLTYSDCSEP